MNIEIKFRAKNKIGWIYGYLSYANILNKKVMCIYDGNGDCIVDIDTIGQFTGLHDKNGNDIYEGDIIQLQCKENKYNCLVDWNINLGAWCISIDNKCLGVKPLGEWLREDSFIVIGNIFDNPELLEDKK
ncbi:hypothetical protein DW982_12270 [Phocaeicola plebeius]|jgi:uncharacterized phage protein (TIGR01671 family)|uniref:YopX protein domain-containing protein n=1 Tax=Phocaeicola plebeius TaxID=310297 RepID=A0A3E4WFF7_9BACT|nr:YopX family protein [Phocaeicola plebeius]RGM40973.1 hypothetical protein DXC17_06305 [Phocaeicola plebeius]RGZ54046.1 hypothetical protein DW982_12270 [Phocaeicola plebeius]